MIKMSEIVKSSVPAFSLTISSTANCKRFLSYMNLNMEWLKEFDKIIFCINGEKLPIESFMHDFTMEYPDIVPTLIYRENLGHTFGTLDIDFATWEYAKQNPDIEYIWKFAGDTLANPSIFDIEIDETCDFFYINNIGCDNVKVEKDGKLYFYPYQPGSSYGYDSKEDLIQAVTDQTYFYPQTNYYFYKPQSIKRWYPDSNEILKLKEEYQKILTHNPEIKPWEALQGKSAGFENQEFVKTNRPLDIEGCACEAYLGYTALANNLKMQQLAPLDSLNTVIDLMTEHNLHDGSHKNFLYEKVGGLCHYHVMNGQAVPL
jgi:hypothetical protein